MVSCLRIVFPPTGQVTACRPFESSCAAQQPRFSFLFSPQLLCETQTLLGLRGRKTGSMLNPYRKRIATSHVFLPKLRATGGSKRIQLPFISRTLSFCSIDADFVHKFNLVSRVPSARALPQSVLLPPPLTFFEIDFLLRLAWQRSQENLAMSR